MVFVPFPRDLKQRVRIQCTDLDLDNGLHAVSGTPYTVYPWLVGNMCYRCIVSGVSVLRIRSQKRGKRVRLALSGGKMNITEKKENNNNNKY